MGAGDAGGDARGHPRVHSHAAVPPHCAGSSSVASLPCGHTREKEKGREARDDRGGEREKGSNSDRFGMDRGRVPINRQSP